MNKELIINATANGGVDIALLEDKKLVELHSEKSDGRFAVGDLYLGKVKKLIPGLNAAFVDVGYEKDAFLFTTRHTTLMFLFMIYLFSSAILASTSFFMAALLI